MKIADREHRHRVFLSYASPDRQFARGLNRALRRLGMKVFFDEADIAAGESVGMRLQRALKATDWYVVIVSNESLRSPSLNFEIGAAIAQGRQALAVYRSRRAKDQAHFAPFNVWESILVEGASPGVTARRILDVVSVKAEDPGLSRQQVMSVADELAGLSYKQARSGFTIPGLGKLVLVDRKAQGGHKPATGEQIQVPTKRVSKFRIAKQDRLSAGTDRRQTTKRRSAGRG